MRVSACVGKGSVRRISLMYVGSQAKKQDLPVKTEKKTESLSQFLTYAIWIENALFWHDDYQIAEVKN